MEVKKHGPERFGEQVVLKRSAEILQPKREAQPTHWMIIMPVDQFVAVVFVLAAAAAAAAAVVVVVETAEVQQMV